MDTFIHPSQANLQYLESLQLSGPVVMINLLRFNGATGLEAYAKYAEAAAPFLESYGAKVTYAGIVAAAVVGDEKWDEILLVQYPSVDVFFTMTNHQDYPGQLRADSLADSRLYCSQPDIV